MSESIIPEYFRIDARPAANPRAIVLGPGVRFTVLTEQVLRLEYDPAEHFEDRPSQIFWYRQQPVPPFTVTVEADQIILETAHLQLRYVITPRGFAADTLSITLKSTGTTWHYGDNNLQNLGGTIRTLDDINGPTRLDPGLMSRSGWAVVDDSESLVFNEAGWLEVRQAASEARDLYFFGYGHDYMACLRDYALLTGPTPLIPRWALGNWWSRYWAYTEDELTALIEDFQRHQVPLSVCIVDMDWHITDTGNQCSGWTGYTWNRVLFPDPDRFLRYLHSKGLRIALNLHPAEGVHPHEERYAEMARRMGVDPASEKPIPFDIADPRFARAYFEVLHHPEEARGVDFWWLDWQQGTLTSLPNLDPLWWLNHLHFLDLGRVNKRAFVFSRWGGLGNHRYPIGFSGDTLISWETLAFQPYFTSTAANVAYSWWSHDIGGHHLGVETPELYLRWVQYGAFSPILRIHCTNNPFHDRRPWAYDAETFRHLQAALQLRHALIPYIYTMAWLNHTSYRPLIQPMYHHYPEQEEAYHCPQQYTFGTELIAAPYVAPADPDTQLSRQVVWLPAGDWYDFFSGEYYHGDAWYAVYGATGDIPVFARAGAIVPLGPLTGWGGTDTPSVLDVHLFAGADGHFTLYEDDGNSPAYLDGQACLTDIAQACHPDHLTITVQVPRGDTTLIPEKREYRLHIHGIAEPSRCQALINEQEVPLTLYYDTQAELLTVTGLSLSRTATLHLEIFARGGSLLSHRNRTQEKCQAMLRVFRLHSAVKQSLARRLADLPATPRLLADYAARISDSQIRALLEVTLGAGMHHISGTDCADRFILWNNHGVASMRYGFSLAYANRFHTDSGEIPRFKAIIPEREMARLRGGQRHPRWKFTAQYLDLVSVTHTGP